MSFELRAGKEGCQNWYPSLLFCKTRLTARGSKLIAYLPQDILSVFLLCTVFGYSHRIKLNCLIIRELNHLAIK